MKKLLLSMRVTEASNYEEKRNSLAYDYINLFESFGFLLILIPNNTNNLKKYFDKINPDGIILTGGNNVNPKLYGGKNELKGVFEERDYIEKQLLETAINKQVPILGICRGFQFINVFFGGKISHNVDNHVNKDHKLISKIPLLSKLVTNSFHNQSIYISDLSDQLTPIAYTDDSVIEAFTHKVHKILGLQWHPERHNIKQDKKLICDFFNK